MTTTTPHVAQTRRASKVLVAVALATALVCSSVILSASPASAAQTISRNCNSAWVGWAEYIDYGDNIKMRLRPTKRAWAAMGLGATKGQMWDAYFACIGWDDGFSRLRQSQWDSLWLQHRCHEYLGIIGRLKSGATFDYESWVPNRGSLTASFRNGCN